MLANCTPVIAKIPYGERLKEIVEGFETCWGFPQAIGAIDGTHILIIQPQHSIKIHENATMIYQSLHQNPF